MYNYIPEVIILRDSVNSAGDRITTFQLKYQRFIHSEFMTHRMFSRNAQSSRATPVQKNIDAVRKCPWAPAVWTENQHGMVGKPLPVTLVPTAVRAWETAAKNAADQAEALMKLGVHKQICNRILEPFLPITVIVTATDWDNFFKLRCASDADPTMQLLANTMKEHYDLSEPVFLQGDEWHRPYITPTDIVEVRDWMDQNKMDWSLVNSILNNISAARCARVSYRAYDGTSSIEKDLTLFAKLITFKHMTPLEHIATPFFGHNANLNGWRSWRMYKEEFEAVNVPQ